jgi:Na+/H+ antiporter NhaA
VEYFILPLFSFKNTGLTGFGRNSFNIIPHVNFIRMVTITLQGTHFGAPGDIRTITWQRLDKMFISGPSK